MTGSAETITKNNNIIFIIRMHLKMYNIQKDLTKRILCNFFLYFCVIGIYTYLLLNALHIQDILF